MAQVPCSVQLYVHNFCIYMMSLTTNKERNGCSTVYRMVDLEHFLAACVISNEGGLGNAATRPPAHPLVATRTRSTLKIGWPPTGTDHPRVDPPQRGCPPHSRVIGWVGGFPGGKFCGNRNVAAVDLGIQHSKIYG